MQKLKKHRWENVVIFQLPRSPREIHACFIPTKWYKRDVDWFSAPPSSTPPPSTPSSASPSSTFLPSASSSSSSSTSSTSAFWASFSSTSTFPATSSSSTALSSSTSQRLDVPVTKGFTLKDSLASDHFGFFVIGRRVDSILREKSINTAFWLVVVIIVIVVVA